MLVNPRYEFLFKTDRKHHINFGNIITCSINRRDIVTGEERIYTSSESFLIGESEHPIRVRLFNCLMKEVLEIKVTHKDEN